MEGGIASLLALDNNLSRNSLASGEGEGVVVGIGWGTRPGGEEGVIDDTGAGVEPGVEGGVWGRTSFLPKIFFKKLMGDDPYT